MSGLLHPKGPEPASVYWRRRAALVGGLIAVVVLTWLQIAANEPKPSNSPGTVTVIGESPSATAIESATEQPSQEPTDQASPVQTEASSGPPRCAKADLKVAAAIDRTQASVGEGLHITLSVTNTSNTSCVRNLGSGANEVSVISGGATVWSSDYCNPSAAKKDTTLAAGQKWSVEVVWSGKVTRSGCDVRGAAPKGTYYATARNGKISAKNKRFVIR